MNALEILNSATTEPSPPAGLSDLARTLWLAKAGQWEAAHDLCQEIPGAAGSWLHAYLHREEGDLGNAAYWYHRAGKPVPATGLPLASEWQQIATELLG